MNLAAILHQTTDNYCYAVNKDELIINIKTGYDVKKVYLIYGDPYSGGIMGGDWKWDGAEEEIYFKKELKHHMFWTTTIRPKYKRARYYFKLISETETVYFFEEGFLSEEEMHKEGISLQCFTFPWMNEADISMTPYWVNDTIWYQIFPERFCNGDTSNDPQNVKAWQSKEVSNRDFYGGDLKGILLKLPYVKELGITGLYLTPIFSSPSTHKYDTSDYFKLDAHFGDEATLHELVDTAHSMGIKIMLDGVFNHCGTQFAPWQDVVEKGKDSKYFDWFMIQKLPIDPNQKDTKDGSYYSFAFAPNMPKLNTNNKKVRDYFLSVCKYWASEFHIDGLRLDVANELSHCFCKELRIAMKEMNPDFYLLGEIWHNAGKWLSGDEFDAVMNYPLAGGIGDFFVDEEATKKDFEYTVNRCYTMYQQQTNDVLFNLLDSHDTQRLRNKVKSIDEFYQQLAIVFTMPGSPCIFYGTEIAMEGKHDPDCRRCMPWEEIKGGIYDEEITIMKQLIAFRKHTKAAKSRHFHFPNKRKESRLVEYIKIDEDGKQIEILINAQDKDIPVENEEEILFSRGYHKEILKAGGILIRSI